VELFFREASELADTPGLEPGSPSIPNPIFVCASCGIAIKEDEVSVHHLYVFLLIFLLFYFVPSFVSRSGFLHFIHSERNWHWGCLRCNSCHEPLKDGMKYSSSF
jgi:hypothetical protein